MDENEQRDFDRMLLSEPVATAPRAPDTRMPSQGGTGGGGMAQLMSLMNMPQAGG